MAATNTKNATLNLAKMYNTSRLSDKTRLKGNISKAELAPLINPKGAPSMAGALGQYAKHKAGQGIMQPTKYKESENIKKMLGSTRKHKYTQSGAPVSSASRLATLVTRMVEKLKEQAKINLEQRGTA